MKSNTDNVCLVIQGTHFKPDAKSRVFPHYKYQLSILF